MRIRTGIVTGRELRRNRDGQRNRVMLQVRIGSPEDIQTVELFTPPGHDINPPNGALVIVLEITGSYRIAIAADDLIEPSALPGEHRMYATDGIDILSYIDLLTDGTIELNGAADFAVRFNALETQMQTLVQAINTALGTKLDGAGTPGTLILDLSGAKVDEVKLP